MKKILFLSTFLITSLCTIAQQNNPVKISSIQVYDYGDGTGFLEFRIVGATSMQGLSISATVSGDIIPGGSMTTMSGITSPCLECPPSPGGGNSYVAELPIALLPPTLSGGNEMVNIEFDLSGAAIISPTGSATIKRPRRYY